MVIWIHAPKGFRPSTWPEMLCEIDEAFDLDSHLVDPGYQVLNGSSHQALQVLCSLLDESGDKVERRAALFRELMSRVASLGLQVTVPEGFSRAYPTWWQWLEEFCAKNKIVLTKEPSHSHA